jgi:hypothetical protein
MCFSDRSEVNCSRVFWNRRETKARIDASAKSAARRHVPGQERIGEELLVDSGVGVGAIIGQPVPLVLVGRDLVLGNLGECVSPMATA